MICRLRNEAPSFKSNAHQFQQNKGNGQGTDKGGQFWGITYQISLYPYPPGLKF
jgi:hypothetical protein